MTRILTIIAPALLLALLVSSCNKRSSNKIHDKDCITPSNITPPSDCDYLYEPVCGCDSKTYRNACFAKSSGLKSWTQGACSGACIDKSIVLNDEICTREMNPVCGCNGITYSNPCVARKSGVLSYQKGECGEIQSKD